MNARFPVPDPLGPDELARLQSVVAAGFTNDVAVLRAGRVDPHPAVRVAALGGLSRAGVLRGQHLQTAVEDDVAAVRRRACELAAVHRRMKIDVVAMLADVDPSVVEMAAWACGERGRREAVIPLVQVAGEHADALCREAAVAALGSIGDRRGLPAVLAGCRDKPAVRRRAVAALAAFDGPEVDAALESALTDRDLQVRQIAEDLRQDRH